MALLPGGFPLLHPRTFANRALPLVLVAAAAFALAASHRQRRGGTRAVLLALAGLWLGTGLTGWQLFPEGFRYLEPSAMAVAALLTAAALTPDLRAVRWPRATVPLAFAGVLAGVAFAYAQRAPAPETRPLNQPPPSFASMSFADLRPSIRLSGSARVAPATGELTLQRGPWTVSLDPRLTFVSRSPERFWTLFAPAAARAGPRRTLTGWREGADGVHVSFADDGATTLHAAADGDAAVEVEAFGALPSDVYSHLNTYAQLAISGHQRLSIAFSPCPDKPVDVLPMEYPVGAPARLAYLDAQGTFHVVEASSGEKGPFHELARGPMARADPLVLTLLDRDRPFARVTFRDWAAQASTQLSPTAGWGLPANAVEFSLQANRPGALAAVFLTLANTSTGRGFDSVGHAAGTYRNRMRFEWLPTGK